MKAENRELEINKGFTLVELVVSVAIIAVISGVIFWSGRGSNDRLEVTAVAQELSLAIRQAQNYAFSVRENQSNLGNFSIGYGIAMDTSYSTYSILFGDTDGDKIYDGTPACSNECLEKILLRNGVTISSLCATSLLTGTETCSGTYRSVQVSFIRPNLDAVINIINTSDTIEPGPWTSAKVRLRSRQGVVKDVSISNTGQVSIQ